MLVATAALSIKKAFIVCHCKLSVTLAFKHCCRSSNISSGFRHTNVELLFHCVATSLPALAALSPSPHPPPPTMKFRLHIYITCFAKMSIWSLDCDTYKGNVSVVCRNVYMMIQFLLTLHSDIFKC